MKSSFQGTSRFVVKRALGQGGMGAVYEVLDTQLDTHVAFKQLTRGDGESLLKFKNEFRALQDLEHPNLVSLGELFKHEGAWFFTMELIHGVDFLTYVRGANSLPVSSMATATQPMRGQAVAAVPERAHGIAAFDQELLRAALLGLGRGLQALHEAGKVHCDVKPSNILVEDSGRLVLVDFGLVSVTASATIGDDPELLGTAAYMAPERFDGHVAEPAADMYAVGVMLHEVLCGRLPFRSDPARVLRRQLDHLPTPDDAVGQLIRLCLGLLDTDPAQRLSAAELVRQFDPHADANVSLPAIPELARTDLIGREAELQQLADAFADTGGGHAVTVIVHGESGIGKSSFIDEFASRCLEGSKPPIILSGRCFERESVPFQGVDGVMTALARYVVDLPSEQVDALLPKNPRSMVRLFPILERIAAIENAALEPRVSDPVRERRRVFGAVREFLARLAQTRPVIVTIDDFQWSDADTHLLLNSLMQPPDAPGLLLVLSTYEQAQAMPAAAGDVRDIALPPLRGDDAAKLASALLRSAGAPDHANAETLAREARGHPFYITELAQHVVAVKRDDSQPLLLEDAVALRASHLTTEARRILEIVCVAAGPISWVAVQRASKVAGPEFLRHISALRVSQMVRAWRGDDNQTIEPYHDHLRRGMVALVSMRAQREHHGRLATALYDLGVHRRKPEMLLRHLRGAERLREAARFAERAGRRASEAMAFTRAASLFRTALELGQYGAERTRRLQIALAWSLVNAGHATEAAETFAKAAVGAEPNEQRECYRMAAQEWLITGHLDEGLAALNTLLASIGSSLPRTQRRALASLAWQRARLATRRIEWKPAKAKKHSAATLAKLGVYQAAAQSLLPVDILRGANANAQFLLLALRVGEPAHAAVAIGLEAIFLCGMGVRARRKARRLFRQVLEIEHSRPDDPYLAGWAWLVDGFMAYLESRFSYAADMMKNAEEQFVQQTVGTTWERSNSRLIHVFALRYLGDIRTMTERVDQYCLDARELGDKYLEGSMRFGRTLGLLAANEPDAAERELAHAPWVPAKDAYHLQHWYALEAKCEIALYRGTAAQEIDGVAPAFKALSKSLLPKVKIVRSVSRYLRARLLLAGSGSVTGELPKLARQLEREQIGYADVFAALVRAGIAARTGNEGDTALRLRRAIELSNANDMRLCGAAATRHLGRLIGGEEGSELLASADNWMAKEDIRDPAAMSEIVAPGCNRSR